MVAELNTSAWTETVEQGDARVVRICGELDASCADAVEAVVLDAVRSAPSITFDLARLTFCDSSGLSMFVRALEKAEAEGSAMTIRELQPQVRRVFAVMGLDRALPVVDAQNRS